MGDLCRTALCLVVGIGVTRFPRFTAELPVVSARVIASLSDILEVFEAAQEVGDECCCNRSGEEDGGDERRPGHLVQKHGLCSTARGQSMRQAVITFFELLSKFGGVCWRNCTAAAASLEIQRLRTDNADGDDGDDSDYDKEGESSVEDLKYNGRKRWAFGAGGGVDPSLLSVALPPVFLRQV